MGSSYSQIIDHIEEIYGVGFSKPAVTDKLIPMLEEWKKRPLDAIYPFIYLDAIHYKVREDGHYITKAFYTVLNKEHPAYHKGIKRMKKKLGR